MFVCVCVKRTLLKMVANRGEYFKETLSPRKEIRT